MKYDENFTRRLRGVLSDFQSKKKRAEQDQESYDDFRANHPEKATNHRGEPRWEGSEAQRQLKEDIANQYHWDKTPKELWEHPERTVYKDLPLTVFRDHIYQEERLIKHQNLTKLERAKKGHIDNEEEEKKQELGGGDVEQDG
jgi:hypothetical protein